MRWLSFGAKTVARTFYAQFASEDGGGQDNLRNQKHEPDRAGMAIGLVSMSGLLERQPGQR
jgi:hypothetical protein